MGSAVASEETPAVAGSVVSGDGGPPETAGAGEGCGHPPAGKQAAGTSEAGDSSSAAMQAAASQTAQAAAATQAATMTASGTTEGALRREAEARIAEQPGGGGSGGGPGTAGKQEPATPSTSRPNNTDSTSSSSEGMEGGVQVEKRNEYSACCRWSLTDFSKIKARALWSRYFEVGGYDCRLLVYPRGDSQALPGYISIYLQVTDPRGSSAKWDCFASYRLCVANQRDEGKSLRRDSWHRFSSKKKSHGWCDFTPLAAVLEPKAGFFVNDCVVITAEILVLHEAVTFTRDAELGSAAAAAAGGSGSIVSVSSSGSSSSGSEILSGKFTWKVHNFSLFKEMIKTQKIMSPVFPAGECNLRLSVYQSNVGNSEYLSMCMESKDTEKVGPAERSCWCLFRTSVMSQLPAHQHMHRDSYGRFAADNKSGDNTSLGWNDFMPMSDFNAPENGYLVEDTAVFSAGFHIIKESSTFSRLSSIAPVMPRKMKGSGLGDNFQGKFTWKIENFTRLKDLLKKRKITGLCIKSKRFQVGGRDCRLIVYPRGQSQPPMHLSMFLEVTDPNNMGDWSCFVSHRLSVVNQRSESERSMTKESQNRYSKTAKDWGWREFVTLTALFDQDSGFLVGDSVVFSAEVLILKESSDLKDVPASAKRPALESASRDQAGEAPLPALAVAPPGGAPPPPGHIPGSGSYVPVSFSWKVENFVAFKEIMETRKIFSRYFSAGGCELRIGVYESFETLCIYLESDSQAASCAGSGGHHNGSNNTTPSGPAAGVDQERNFWVRYCIAVINQKHPERTEWKESSICTKTWNNSVLQFMKMSELLDSDAGFLTRDTVVFGCEVLDCCPWFEFADLEVYASDEDGEALSTDADELLDSEDSEDTGAAVEEEDVFCSILARCRAVMTYIDSPPHVADPSDFQAILADRLQSDSALFAEFLAGLRTHLEDPAKLYALLAPMAPPAPDARKPPPPPAFSMASNLSPPAPSLLSLLMGIKCLQLPIVDLLLDVTIAACHSHRLASQAEWAAQSKDSNNQDLGDASTAGKDPTVAGNSSASLKQQDGLASEEKGGSAGQGTRNGQQDPASEANRVGDGSEQEGSPANMPAGDARGNLAGSSSDGLGRHQTRGGGEASDGPMASGSMFPFVGGSLFHPGLNPSSGLEQGLRGSSDSAAMPFPDPFAGWMFSAGDLDNQAGPSLSAGFPPPTSAAMLSGLSHQSDAVSAADEMLSMVVNALRGAVCALDPMISYGGDSEPVGASGSSAPETPVKSGASKGGKKGSKGRGGGQSADTPSKQRQADSAGGSSSSSSTPQRSKDRDLDTDMAAALATQSPTVHRISDLLSSAPSYLQADIILLVPRLVEPLEHTAAAGVLLGRLAEASREGPEVEAELRIPVLAALGLLRIDPAVAEKVLHAALDALPTLSESELPPAVGLVLKLSCESGGSRASAVRTVRERVDAAGSTVSAGTIDAIRLAVQQHPEVAAAFLADIEEDLKSAKPPPTSPGAGRGKGPSLSLDGVSVPGTSSPSTGAFKTSAGPGVFGSYLGISEGANAMHMADTEVLLDLCRVPEYQSDAEQLFEKTISKGLIMEPEIVAALERRRMQQLVASNLPPQLFNSVGGAGGTGPQAGGASGPGSMPQSTLNTPGKGTSKGQGNTFGPEAGLGSLLAPPMPPAGLAFPPPAGAMQSSSSFPMGLPPLLPQLGLGSLGMGMGLSAGFPFGSLLGLGDFGLPLMGGSDFDAALALAEILISSKALRARAVVSAIYSTLFRLYGDQASRERLLLGLVNRAGCISAKLPSQGSENSGPSTSSKGSKSASTPPKSSSQGRATERQTSKVARDVLLSLMEEHSVCAQPVLAMLLGEVSDLQSARSKLEGRIGSLENELQTHQDETQALRSSVDKAQEHGMERIKGLEEALSRAKADKAAEIDKFAEERRELENRLREAENQVEWARGEQKEEAARASRELRDVSQRLQEADQQMTKLKNAKREEMKRLTKEKSALADRLKGLEGTQRHHEEELRRLTEEKARAGKEAERALSAEGARVQAEKRAANTVDQLAQAKQYIDSLESKLNHMQGYVASLETNLKEEMTRHAPLYGANLESLNGSELDTLIHIHDEGIKRIQAIFAHRQEQQDDSAGQAVSASVTASLGLGPTLPAGAAPPMGPTAAGPIGFGRAMRGPCDFPGAVGPMGSSMHGGLPGQGAAVEPPSPVVGPLFGGSAFAPGPPIPPVSQAQAGAGSLLHGAGGFQNGFGRGLGPGFGTGNLPSNNDLW